MDSHMYDFLALSVPERAVKNTSPAVPLANLLSCIKRVVSAIWEKGMNVSQDKQNCNNISDCFDT